MQFINILHFFKNHIYYFLAGLFVILLINIIIYQKNILYELECRSVNVDKFFNSLNKPSVAGQWGENQLKRLIEISGMLSYVDFSTQQSILEGRPDMMIKLPNKGIIYIDSKAPLTAYLNIINENDASQYKKTTKELASKIKGHIKTLYNKAYHNTGDSIFTVVFLPSESLLNAALEADNNIIEYAFENNVIIATPMSLLCLLRIIAYGWQNVGISFNSAQIHKTLKETNNQINNLQSEIEKLEKTLKAIKNSVLLINNTINDLK